MAEGTIDGDTVALSNAIDRRTQAPGNAEPYTLERLPFRCPEELKSSGSQKASLQEFIKSYTSRLPNYSTRDLMVVRYKLLVAHSCTQTLNSMLFAVSPLSVMLRLVGRNFGPSTEEFDPATKVWTVRYTKDGKSSETSDEDLIFNFYGWRPPTWAEAIAQAFIRQTDIRIRYKFEAPDDITKARAFFIYFEMLPPAGESNGSVGITKICSVGAGAYAVTLLKKIGGDSAARIDKEVGHWLLSEDGKAIVAAVARVGVEPAWEEHFAETHK